MLSLLRDVGWFVKRVAFAALLASCAVEVAPRDAATALDAAVGMGDAFVAPDALGAFDPACLERCATCSIGPCNSLDRCGTAGPRAACIVASITCDELRTCIGGPRLFAGVDDCTGGVLAAMTLASIEPLARDTDSYRPPSALVVERIGLAIEEIAAFNGIIAGQHAEVAGYELCRGTGDEDGLLLLRPSTPGTGHASIVIRYQDPRPLVLEAPHPLYDMGTLEESVAIFTATNARALVASGTHRCASDRPSGCDGTADACGTGAAVRESDMAHAVDSAFHAAHLALAAAYPEDWFVGVHGFEGPGASVSNGTNDPVAPTSRAARLAVALHERFGADVTTCNDFGGASITTEERVCGTTDVQGRALNESPLECTTAATTATDRFAHIEQAPEYRPERAADVAAAILEVLGAP